MLFEDSITISMKRYEQLIRAEQDANLLKAAIADCYQSYTGIDYPAINLLHSAFIGKKEEVEE